MECDILNLIKEYRLLAVLFLNTDCFGDEEIDMTVSYKKLWKFRRIIKYHEKKRIKNSDHI